MEELKQRHSCHICWSNAKDDFLWLKFSVFYKTLCNCYKDLLERKIFLNNQPLEGVLFCIPKLN